MMAITYEEFSSWYDEQWFDGSIALTLVTHPVTGLRCRYWAYWAATSGYLPFMTVGEFECEGARLAGLGNGGMVPTPFISAYGRDIPF